MHDENDDNDDNVTERPGRVGTMHFASRCLGLGFTSRLLGPAILIEDFCIFCQPVQANVCKISRILVPPSESFPDHYTPIIISCALFQASTAIYIRSALFRVSAQRTLAILYRLLGQPIGLIFKGTLDILALEDGTDNLS